MQKDVFDVQSFPSLEGYSSQSRSQGLRVLIATEEIIGPVRNGGIASTYFHLARGLAAQGHDVTVLYLRGAVVENESPEHWVDQYRQYGIDLVYLPNIEGKMAAASRKWQGRWIAFYRWLRDNDRFDVVHSSEWRGGAFYCLQAKQMGLAFHNTLFITKTSSPHIWNRHYQMQPIKKLDLVVASFAEQKCVEWADIVVGGSAHLLSFMDHIGYRLPESRTFAQPNIVDFSEVKIDDRRPSREIGDVVKTGELVFFGRLEQRKGLEFFVYAVNILVARGLVIERVTFLGKEGEKMASQGNRSPLDFIRDHIARWPFPVDIVTDLNQPEALSLICSRDMIAVMPSLIENSTMAVYEALVHKIPFVATGVGGTPELIMPDDHQSSLVEPDAQELAARLEVVLKEGQVIAEPAFDNDENLETWYGFHRYLAEHGAGIWSRPPATADVTQTIAYICVPSGPAELERLVRSLGTQPDSITPTLCIAFPQDAADSVLIDEARAKGAVVVETLGSSVGECFNRAIAECDADICVFCGSDAVVLKPGFCAAIASALHERPKDLVTSAFLFASKGLETDTLFIPLGGDVATQSLTRAAYGIEFVAGKREAFHDIGLFGNFHVAAGTIYEFLGRGVAGGRELFVIPEPLFAFTRTYDEIAKNDANCDYLVRKKVLENADLATHKLLLMSSNGSVPQKYKDAPPQIIAGAHRSPNEIAWLTNIKCQGRLDDKIMYNNAIFLGFDCKLGILKVAIRHKGEFVVLLNQEAIRREENFDSDGEFEILEFPLLKILETVPKAQLRIELISDSLKATGIAFQQLDEDTFYLGSHRPIYWGRDFEEMLGMVEELRAERLNRPNGKMTTNTGTPSDSVDIISNIPADLARGDLGDVRLFARVRNWLKL